MREAEISAPAQAATVQVPSVGRVVAYYSFGTPGGEHPPAVRAAIITEVVKANDPFSTVGLAVLNPTGLFFDRAIKYGPGQPGHWGWLTYVPPVAIVTAKEEGQAK